MFNGYTTGQALQFGGNTSPGRDDNSYYSADLNGNPTKISIKITKSTSWNLESNYGYRLIDGYNTNNTDTKAFCTKYAGCFNSQSGIKYISDRDLLGWVKTTISSPCLSHIDFSDSSSSDIIPSGLINGGTYRIQNVNSGLYLNVAGAEQANGTNVQQWGTDGTSVHDVWKLVDTGSGYYNIISQIGDGKTYYLNVAGNSTGNGTNIEIYQANGGDSQKFYIEAQTDGSYIIKTKITNNGSAVEIADAGKGSGDNVQQWSLSLSYGSKGDILRMETAK